MGKTRYMVRLKWTMLMESDQFGRTDPGEENDMWWPDDRCDGRCEARLVRLCMDGVHHVQSGQNALTLV